MELGIAQAELEDHLFEIVMQGDWPEVIKIYETNSQAYKAKITVSEDTALHIAILDGRTDEVKILVDLIGDNLDGKMMNVVGNTPLHLAASMGNVEMCKCIAKKNEGLLDARNKNKETPLFLAALKGNKDAFLCLLEICGYRAFDYCRRGDGETILHCAIAGEYFGEHF